MVIDVADELLQIVETSATKLKRLDARVVGVKSDPAKWSIQEILGHLVDSAANNHQRFVRAQAGGNLVFPDYAQDTWVRVQGYDGSPWPELVELWRLYNRHLAQVITRIPEAKKAVECRIGEDEPVSLQYLAEDYVVHLKHHLAQIEARSRLDGATKRPAG
jgi:hypothetical protein